MAKLPGLFKRKDDSQENKKEININEGSTGLLNVESIDKSAKYAHLLNEITDQTVNDLARIFEDSRTKTQAFVKIEDYGIPLEYLIALGITTEEQIYAYQTIRERGILEDIAEGINAKGTTVDEDYAMEILQISREMPAYKDINGNQLELIPTIDQLYDLQVQEIIDLKREISRLELQAVEYRAMLQKGESIEPSVDDDQSYVSNVLMELEQAEVVDVGDLTVMTEEEEQAAKEEQDWRNELNKLMKRQKEMMDTKESSGGSSSDVGYSSDVDDDTRKVYILSTKFDVPEIDGYTIQFIEEPVDLNYFTNSKNNLMVITKNIPRRIINIFVEWIAGIASRTEGGYRMVTLKGEELTHELIEGTVELTKESLDDYYETHELSKYTGEGVGTFLDVSYIVDEFPDD